jgi:hypothetical protein
VTVRRHPAGLVTNSVTKSDLLRALLQKRPSEAMTLNDRHAAGLSIRIGPKSGTWYLRLRVADEGGVSPSGKRRVGKQHRVCLGDQAKHSRSPVEALAAAATANGATVAKLGADFVAHYVLIRKTNAARKYQISVEVSINPHLGTLLADLVTREDIRKKRCLLRTRSDQNIVQLINDQNSNTRRAHQRCSHVLANQKTRIDLIRHTELGQDVAKEALLVG